MNRVLFLFPTLWDEKQLTACRSAWESHIEPRFTDPPDAECPWNLELSEWIERLAVEHTGRAQGVTSTSDYPGAAAAALLARRLGLPGPAPRSVIQAGHKYLARRVQGRAVPEAVPEFRLIDPRDPGEPLPCPYFVKPVKGSFSLLARRIDRPGELAEFLDRPATREFLEYYVHIFGGLLAGEPELGARADCFLAESLLRGDQVTVEGFLLGGEPVILGVVDSVMHPGTGSFLRFDYPSRHPEPVQEEMMRIASAAARALELDGAMFNVELIREPDSGRIHILELNPRLCGQFADLHLEVDGTSTYETLVDLALGRSPREPARRGGRSAASSYPLRVFEPTQVLRVPDRGEIDQIEARYPGTRIWLECAAGDRLEDFDLIEDGASRRYGVVNIAGEARADVERRFREIVSLLDLRLSPAASGVVLRAG